MNEPINLEKLILELVYHDNYQPLKSRAIAKKLKLIGDEKNVNRKIKKLVQVGRLEYGPKHLIMKPKNASSKKAKAGSKPTAESDQSTTSEQTSKNEVTGTFRRAAAGFGFVTPQGSTATDRSDDIFVPKQKTLDAANLDTVRIRVSRGHGGKGRDANKSSGRVIEVLQRNTNQFVGTYQEHGDFGFVVVDAGVFESGVLVGDAGAKNCKVGDKVVIEMVHFPSIREEGEGVIVEVLGDRGTPGVDTLSIIRQFALPEEFPEPVLQDARDQAEKFNDDAVPEGRKDFTKTTVVTIDPLTARDFDDAISLQQLENGHWELGVHIADVSHFVPLRSDLDNEAFQRGTSVYLPDRVIPMLPEIISNNLASLQPDRLRYCMTAVIEFTAEGIPIGTELYRGAIKSAHRFTYEDIDEYLENDQPWKKKLSPEVFKIVRDMHTLAMTLRSRRMNGGAINLVLPEIKIDLDDDGKVSGAHTVDNTQSHQVIEEFMLAANEAVAQRMVDEKLYLMRRIHPQPTESKLADLTEFVQGLGIECDNLQDRYELKRVIEESEGLPEQHAIHFAVLRSMQKAVYSPEEIGHYALNSKAYCHFTSPIRRYPDLIIHRAVGDLIDGKRPDAGFDRLAMLGKHCSDLEKRATEAERELTKLKLLNFMADKVGEKLHAIITGVEAFGIFAQGIEIPAEGMIPVANLPDDKYSYDRASRVLSGHKADNQFRLGDSIEVRVALVDPDRRLLEFELAGVKPSLRNVTRRGDSGRGDQSRGASKSGGQSRSKPRNKSGGDSRSSDSKSGGQGRSKSRNKSGGDTRHSSDSRSSDSRSSDSKSGGQGRSKSRNKSGGDTRHSSESRSSPSRSKAGGESRRGDTTPKKSKSPSSRSEESQSRKSDKQRQRKKRKSDPPSPGQVKNKAKRKSDRQTKELDPQDWDSNRASGRQKGHYKKRRPSESNESNNLTRSSENSKKRTPKKSDSDQGAQGGTKTNSQKKAQSKKSGKSKTGKPNTKKSSSKQSSSKKSRPASAKSKSANKGNSKPTSGQKKKSTKKRSPKKR